MAHPVAPHLGERHFHAAFFADDALILHPLIFAAKTFVVLDRTENPRAEKAIPLRYERPVVDRLGLLDFAIRPGENLLRACDGDANLVKYLSRYLRTEEIRNLLIHSSL